MNILLESRTFYPSRGGLETVGQQLAEAWRDAGHEVRIMTGTPLHRAEEIASVPVYRNPSPVRRLRLARWCDVFVQSGISLRSLWMVFAARRRVVFIHHNILTSTHRRRWLPARLKVPASRLGHNVAVSQAVAAPLAGPTIVIPNPFRASMAFRRDESMPRSGLLFAGRLVAEKGCHVALVALAHLREMGAAPHLTVCGDGPERSALERQVGGLALQGHVTFMGWTDPKELARQYARAEAVLIPSTYEPFGVVALEALAAGCPVVASAVGGLPEAVGPGGLLVPPHDPFALAEAIREIRRTGVRERLMARVRPHLDAHSIERVSARYLDVLNAVTA